MPILVAGLQGLERCVRAACCWLQGQEGCGRAAAAEQLLVAGLQGLESRRQCQLLIAGAGGLREGYVHRAIVGCRDWRANGDANFGRGGCMGSRAASADQLLIAGAGELAVVGCWGWRAAGGLRPRSNCWL